MGILSSKSRLGRRCDWSTVESDPDPRRIQIRGFCQSGLRLLFSPWLTSLPFYVSRDWGSRRANPLLLLLTVFRWLLVLDQKWMIRTPLIRRWMELCFRFLHSPALGLRTRHTRSLIKITGWYRALIA